jgi:hypothetical protein
MLPILTDIKKAVTALTQRLRNVRATHINGQDSAREPAPPFGSGRDRSGPDRLPQKKGAALRAIVAITTMVQAVDAVRARFDNAPCVE